VKQINPLYIALLLVVALVVVILKLNEANAAQSAAVEALQETEKTAKRIVALQQAWGRGEESASALERLLRSAPLKETEFVTERTRNRIIVRAQSIDKKAADYLLNKLLNNTNVIKTLKIRRLGPQQASLHVEVVQ
jgi:hypothetical protein